MQAFPGLLGEQHMAKVGSLWIAKMVGCGLTAAGEHRSHHVGRACLRMRKTQKKAKLRGAKTDFRN